MVVLEKCLKASTLFLQELQGFLLQQPSSFAHRKTAWRGGRRGGNGGKKYETKEQMEVHWCYIHQYINTLLQACTEIIFKLLRLRKKHPMQLTGFGRRCFCFSLWKGNQCYIQTISHREEQKKTQRVSYSVCQRREVCSIKVAPTGCQHNQHAFQCCLSQRPFQSQSHCCLASTGTQIWTTEGRKGTEGDAVTDRSSNLRVQ